MRNMKMRSQRPAHPVHQRHACIRERHARLRRRQHHRLTRFPIARFTHAHRQHPPNRLHRRQRQRIGKPVRLPAYIRLDRVRQRIRSCIGRQSRRHAQRQLIVHQGCRRHQHTTCDQHLLPALAIGHHGESRHLRARTRRCRNRNMHRPSMRNRMRHLVIPYLSPIGYQHPDRLRRIDRAPPAQAHQAIVSALLESPHSHIHHIRRRVRHRLVKNFRANPRIFNLLLQSLCELCLHQEGIGHDQRLLASELHQQRARIAKRSSANSQDGWNSYLSAHKPSAHRSSLLLFRRRRLQLLCLRSFR